MHISLNNLKPVISSFIDSDIIPNLSLSDDPIKNPIRIFGLSMLVNDPNLLGSKLASMADQNGNVYIPNKDVVLMSLNKAGGKLPLPFSMPDQFKSLGLDFTISLKKEDFEKLYSLMASKGLMND